MVSGGRGPPPSAAGPAGSARGGRLARSAALVRPGQRVPSPPATCGSEGAWLCPGGSRLGCLCGAARACWGVPSKLNLKEIPAGPVMVCRALQTPWSGKKVLCFLC